MTQGRNVEQAGLEDSCPRWTKGAWRNEAQS